MTQFLVLKETAEERGTGDLAVLTLPREISSAGFSSLLSKEEQTTMGKMFPGNHLKISLCSMQFVFMDWEELLSV